MKEIPIDFSRLGDLIHYGYVQLKGGRYVLTPKGRNYLTSHPKNLERVQVVLKEQNIHLRVQALELKRILDSARDGRIRRNAEKSPVSRPRKPRPRANPH